MRIRPVVLTAILACAPVLVALPAEAVATCGGLPATIEGTSGNDEMLGTPLKDVVALGAGNDSFDGLGGDDIICGGAGKDRLAGGEGNDRIFGDAGKDYFIGDAGNDHISGGSGRDYLSYFTQSSGIKVTNGNTIDGPAGHDTTDVETIEGTAYADVMRGGPGQDDFHGLTGKDLLVGGGGTDFLTATAGIIRGGAEGDFVDVSGTVTAYLGRGVNAATIGGGSPKVVGGPEEDEFNFRGRASHAQVDGGGSNNQIVFIGIRRGVTADIGRGQATWIGGTLKFAGVHTLFGTFRKDVLVGSDGADVLYGLAGADVLRGAGGNDLITGQGGKDEADGGSGADYCFAEIRRNCEG